MSRLTEGLIYGTSLNTADPVRVYFLPSGATWRETGTTYRSNGFNAYEKQQTMAALDQWSNVANIPFSQTSSRANADLVLGTTALSGTLVGYFYFPGGGWPSGLGVFGDSSYGWSSTAGGGLDQGGFGFRTLLHEFGHGLGLAHPHDSMGLSDRFPGVSGANDTGLFDLNQGIYTTMTYNSGWEQGPHGGSGRSDYGWEATPGAIDIAAVQEIYGANATHASGNDTYVVPDTNGPGTHYSAIWDTGGTDALVYSGQVDVVLDLRPATLKVEAGGGGFVSYAADIHGGFTIAQGVVIENATGGTGSDTLIGNGSNNILQGGMGRDALNGNSGNDILNGDDGPDRLQDGLGNDRATGGAGRDELFMAAGLNTVSGGEHSDHIIGGIQADVLSGDAGNDVIKGDPNGSFFGGSDMLSGGPGNDILMGGMGADTFVFAPGDGMDIIAGFSPGSVSYSAVPGEFTATPTTTDFLPGVDHIQLSGFPSISAANVMSRVTSTGLGAEFSANGTVILFYGLDVAALSADAFDFI